MMVSIEKLIAIGNLLNVIYVRDMLSFLIEWLFLSSLAMRRRPSVPSLLLARFYNFVVRNEI